MAEVSEEHHTWYRQVTPALHEHQKGFWGSSVWGSGFKVEGSGCKDTGFSVDGCKGSGFSVQGRRCVVYN
jgi:hypothetical protein